MLELAIIVPWFVFIFHLQYMLCLHYIVLLTFQFYSWNNKGANITAGLCFVLDCLFLNKKLVIISREMPSFLTLAGVLNNLLKK